MGGRSVMPARRTLDLVLLLTLAVVVLLTLAPTGSGWTWGAPLAELRWYASGWDSPTAMLQLTGNLALLAPSAALAVARWPGLAVPHRLAAASVGGATAIELMQWALPLGRVVSPLDALLNAAGAVAGGLVAARLAAGTGQQAGRPR
ncbi:VanZ family protein [Blastococcus tunisiensis]|uniref:VanZ like family protein n=1 Tax=Blastococcus tunisiensis TaxID=1798228 RepID=A0A1I2LYI1_9ACTN|nr:VanZ family protein [Blastococcus sp. DSM 46838]SFF84305.1 VanZ like family protein [Blastococcus sp. DSM 46838]